MRNILLAATALTTAISAPAHAQTAPQYQQGTPPIPATPIAYSPAPEGKLDGSIVPTAYKLDLTVDPAQESFSGHVTIEANLKAATQYIYLHGRDLKNVGVWVDSGGVGQPGKWEQVDETGTARAVFSIPLKPGPVTLKFDYNAPFGSGPAGMFRVHVGDEWYSWTQHESIDARASFPGFDEPGFKTPFTVTLRTPKGLTAVSNAPEISTTEEYGQDVHRFAPTLPLPTYLVAMMVGPFAKAEGTVPATAQRSTPLPLRIISPQTNAAKLSFALENSKPIVALLEDYFGQSFPYPKLDQITSPIMPGAMENAGADLYGDSIIVLDDKSPIPQKRNFGMVVAHELAHQWFGDLVTPAWWDDIWLNESFANWMGFYIGNKWRPDLRIGAGATAEGFAAMGTDALVAGRPIHQKIERNSQIDAAFDTITYGKGGHVVAMIAGFMGEDRFRDGVRAYMAKHKYGNASTEEFFGAMADVAGNPRILPAMKSFTDQQGVPLLTFSRTNDGWKVTQERYARLGTKAPETLWGVPLCVRKGATRTCQLLDGKEGTLALSAKGKGAFMPNAGGTGYYRFELPKAEWDALIASADKLPDNEAIALADSLRASYQAGRASLKQLAALSTKLARNPGSHANGEALTGLEMARSAGLFDEKAVLAYRKFVARTFMPNLARMGFDTRAGAYVNEDPERSQRRSSAVAALSGAAKVKEVNAVLAKAAGEFLGGNKAALDPMWYGVGLSAWLEGKGVDGAKALFTRALESQDPSLRPTLLGVIGGSGNKDIGTWVLNDAKDKRLRTSERLNLLRAVIASSGTRDMGYYWMNAHLGELVGGAGGIFFTSKLPQMLNGFCSTARADQIATDLRPRLAGKTAELELERTIERVRSCGVLQTARKAEASKEMLEIK